MEVIVRCVECGADLEETGVEIKYGDSVYINISPCPDCIEKAASETI